MAIHPFSLSNIFLLLISAGLVVYLFFVWHLMKRNTEPKNLKVFQKPVVRFVTIYAAYFFIVCMLASQNFFRVTTMPPRFLLIFLPMLLGIVLLSIAKTNGALRFLATIPPIALIIIQSFRILVEVLFLQFLKEKLIPEQLSFHGRNYDLLIGLLALPIGYLFWKKDAVAKKTGVIFNVLGLLSLANIFSIVIPSLPSSFRIYDTLYLPVYFPGIFIVFLASAAVYLHILSLKQLLAVPSIQPLEKKKAKEQLTQSQLV